MFTQYGNMIAGGQRMMGSWPLGAGGLSGFGFLPLIGFIVLAAIVVAVVIWAIGHRRPTVAHAVEAVGSPAAPAPSGDAALAIARERLARGEIDPDQFVSIITALGGQQPATPASQG